MSRPPLPGPIARLLRWLLPEPDHRTLLSELDETYRLRTAREGPEAARSWLRREGRRAVVHVLRARLRHAGRGASHVLSILLQDVRHGARGLVRAPAFSMAVIVTLALGIGGTTAVFAVVHG
ncbi:MAG TPA: hypothetical protein VLL48_04225, partial [Longimicrobiales bacterium]|nr:hypothetical protein [Longimicrobiales bacterium]